MSGKGMSTKRGRGGGDMGRAVMIHHLAGTPDECQNATVARE